MKESLEQIAQADGRYSLGALKFVYEGLDYATSRIAAESEHVSARTLCEGLKKLAIEKWGRLAILVLNNWGVKNTRDFGEIVYLLIEHNRIKTQPTDSIDDFNDVYDFKTVFDDQLES